MIKRFFIHIFILLFVFFTFTYNVQAKGESGYVFHGYAEINEEFKEDSKVLTKEQGTIEKGVNVSMVVSNIINSQDNSAGDEFFAEITSDIRTEKGVIIPSGSIAHGSITEIIAPKRFNRDANVTLVFDYIATPDGREIPIKATMTTKRHPIENAAVVTAQHAGYALGGGAIGSAVALQTFGIAGAVASNGYTVLGGAAIGAAIGLGIVMSKKGDEVLLAPGDAIQVKFAENLSLPVFNEKALIEEEITNEQLPVKITSIKTEKDPFGEPNTITLGITLVNKTSKTLSTFDMALMNETKALYYPSPFGDTGMWFKKIPPNGRIAGKVSFALDNPKQKLWFVLFDSYTKKPLVKLSLNNKKRELALLEEAAKKNKKKK